jgi:3,4-dihydroxy 2-butanone 4-phosphate synthase/GTP cyclohydrolase II
MPALGVPVPSGDPVERAVASLRRGDVIVLADDDNAEGRMVLAAELASVRTIAFLVRHGTGILQVATPEARARRLRLDGPVDSRHGIKTGESVEDRVATVRLLADPSADAEDLVRPGHVFPLATASAGSMRRTGEAEASVDLMRLAGLAPAAVLTRLLDADGEPRRGADVRAFATEHGLPHVTVGAVIGQQGALEHFVEVRMRRAVDSIYGPLSVAVFRSLVDGRDHVAVSMGDLSDADAPPPLVRIHSECLTGDVFGSARCDCGLQLEHALERVAAEARGVVVYLRGHEGRGIGLLRKLRAYGLQDAGADTVDANLALGLPVDARDYGVGAQILAALGVRRMRLITNNPFKRVGLETHGLEIAETVWLPTRPTAHNLVYLRTKRDRMGHDLRALEDLHVSEDAGRRDS